MIFKFILILFLMINNMSFAGSIIDQTDTDNLYMVRNINAYSKSTTALKAKEEVIINGQRQALKTIFQRAGINENYTKYVNNNVLVEMIESIQIKNEIMTKDSYSSIITVLFNKKFLNFHLKNLGIGIGQVINDTFLYIPILKEGDKFLLNDAENNWYKKTYDTFFLETFDNIFVIDNYDLVNSSLLNEKMIYEADYTSFNTLLKKYNSNVILIAVANYNKEKNVMDISYKEIDANRITEKNLTYANKDNLPIDELYNDIAVRFMEMLNNESKIRVARNTNNSENLAKLLRNNFIDLYIVISNIKDFVYIKNLIVNLNFVKKYEISELTTKLAKIRVHYKEDESEIISMFNNKGFSIDNKNGKYFITYKGF